MRVATIIGETRFDWNKPRKRNKAKPTPRQNVGAEKPSQPEPKVEPKQNIDLVSQIDALKKKWGIDG